MRKLFLILILLCLTACACAEEQVAWTSSLPLLSRSEMQWLTVVNHEQPLAADYVPENLVIVPRRKLDGLGNNENGGVAMASSGTIKLAEEASAAVCTMFIDAEREGVTLYLRTGYRSYKDQGKYFTRARGSVYAQPAGESDFQTGLALVVVGEEYRGTDLTTDFAQTAAGIWLEKNAARYGFIVRYPKGRESVTGNPWTPWQLRYVGSSKVASYIVRTGICLEEFNADYKVALAEFEANGGDPESYLLAHQLPEGPVLLAATDEDGDPDFILFHD